jgi:hypothetical protein
MKKLVLSGLFLIIAGILISGSIMAATGKIKIEVNGQEIETDAEPQSDKGRVIVPISTISKALGAYVQWDSINRKVMITSPASSGSKKSNIWPDEQNIFDATQLRDLISLYFIMYNTRTGDYKSLFSEVFESDFVDPKKLIPGENETDRIIDYEMLDMTFNGTLEDPNQYKARFEVVKTTNRVSMKSKIEKLQLDIEVRWDRNRGHVIDGIWVKDKEYLKIYTLFPGATSNEQQ